MKKILSLALVCVMLLAVGAMAVSAEDAIFVFDVKGVNTAIGGEDAVICTTQDAYDNCNPKWAITVPCKVISANVMQVAGEAIVGSGSVPSVTVGNGTVVLVVHSSTSNTELADQYPNVHAKVAAMNVRAGQYFTLSGIDLEAGTGSGTATLNEPVAPAESSEEPVESSEEPSEEPAESSEEPVESSEEPVESSEEEVTEEPSADESVEESKEESKEAPAESAEESKAEDGGSSTTTIVLIAVALVVLIGVVCFFVIKGKKK